MIDVDVDWRNSGLRLQTQALYELSTVLLAIWGWQDGRKQERI